MLKKALAVAFVLSAVVVAAAVAAPSTFQGTCSNIEFAYNSSQQPVLQATCLAANGSAAPSSLVLQGIGNNNGTLTQGTGASSFQKSCGNIQILVSANGQSVTLSALCRTGGGASNPTSLPLNGISNNNGKLTQN